MANGTKNAIIQKKIDGVIYDLMIRTNNQNVLCDDGVTTLSSKIASLISELAQKQTAADVDNRIRQVIGAAPEALDTLEELADALNNDAGFAQTLASELAAISQSVNGKVDKAAGFGLSSNDYTSAEKTKLSGIAAYANNYVHPAAHAASMITEDTARRFASDTEKTVWNAKARVIAGASAPSDLTENDLFIQILN